MNHVIAGVETEGSLHVVTGSKDRSLRLYKVKKLLFYLLTQNLALSIIIYFLYVSLWLGLLKCDPSVSVDYPKRVGAYKILRGHTSSVQSIAVDPSSDMVIITYSGLSHQCLLLFLLTVTTFPSDLLFRYLALFWFLG